MEYPIPDDPHADLEVARAGTPPDAASAVVLLLHGRGRSAEGILALSKSLEHPRFAYLAPQAACHTWYPHSFLVPLEENEPALSSGLSALDRLVDRLGEGGLPPDRILLVGFSQGGCVAAEFVARNPRRYGGLVAFIGGLFGPEGTPRDYVGSLEGTPVYLGTSDPDPFVPPARVRETGEVLAHMDARVEVRVRPDAGHRILGEDLEHTRGLMEALLGDLPRRVAPADARRPRARVRPRPPRGADRPVRTPPTGR